MAAILTITFSPCIDKSTSVAAMVAEKKLLCSVPKYEPGGGGINVARAIKKLGGSATAIYPAGGYTGKFFTDLLQQEMVPSRVIETLNATRENIIVFDEATGQQYRFGMPGMALMESEWKQCLEAIEEVSDTAYIVASGSLPTGVPPDIFARIAIIARKKNARLIVDTSGEALKLACREGVYLLKPNLGELASLVGKASLNLEEVRAAARSLVYNGHCKIVVVSMGAAGAILVTIDKMHHVYPPPVKRLSTVGAGDSMVAGLVLSLSHNLGLKKTLQYGIACGTAATMNPATGLCKLADVERLYAAIRSKSDK